MPGWPLDGSAFRASTRLLRRHPLFRPSRRRSGAFDQGQDRQLIRSIRPYRPGICVSPGAGTAYCRSASPQHIGAQRQRQRQNHECAAAMKPTPENTKFTIVVVRLRLLAMALAAVCCSAAALPLTSTEPTLRTSRNPPAGVGSPASAALRSAIAASVGADAPDRTGYEPSGRPTPTADALRNVSASGADIAPNSLNFGAQRANAAAAAPAAVGRRTPVPAVPEASGIDKPDAGTFVVLLVTAFAVIAFVANRREE